MIKYSASCVFSALSLLVCYCEALPAFAALPDLTLQTVEGKKVSLDSYAGKVLLASNTASLCGFTPQYKDLQSLYSQYKDRNFIVLGFPSNDFGEQDPGTNEEIKQFCSTKFQISFPIFAKGVVKGAQKQPFFQFLTENSPEDIRGEVQWNFEKFLIDKKGVVRARFGSSVNPMSKTITSKIEELLSEGP